MALTWGATSTSVISATQNPTSITPTMPAGIVAGNLLVLWVGTRSDTSVVSTPAGWTLAGTVAGGGGTFGASTGPSRMTAFYRVATATSADTLGPVALSNTDMAFCQVHRLNNSTGYWSVTTAAGADSTVGTAWSVTCDVNPDIGTVTGAADMCLVGCTNAQAGTTWASESITATGVTAWGTMTEIAEFNSTTGNDINGVTFRRQVSAGASTAPPVITATLAGTTTNARGVALLLRAREAPAPAVPANGSGSGSWSFAGVGAGVQPGPVPTIVGSFANNPGAAQTSTASFVLPAGIADGDVGAFQVSVNGGPTTADPTTPAGWSLISVQQNAANNLRSWLFRKSSMSAAESGATVTLDFAVGFRWNITGAVVRNGTLDTSAEWADTTDDLTLTIPSVNPTAGETLLLTLAGIRYAGTTPLGVTAAGSWTELQDIATTNATVPTIGAWAGSSVLRADSSAPEDMVFASSARANGFLMAFSYAAPAVVKTGAGSGAWTFAGSGAGQRAPKGSGGGAWSFTGAGSGKRTAKAAGSGGFDFTGAGSGRRAPKAAGSSAWSFAGSGSGKAGPARGAGSGAWTFLGAGSGRRAPKAAGSSAWSFAGAGSGAAPTVAPSLGSGGGAWSLTGSGTGRRLPKAAGSGSLSFSGAGSAATPRRGSGLGGWAFDGAGSGARAAQGGGAGTWAVDGTGSGLIDRRGAGTGLLAWSGVGLGVAPLAGVKQGFGTSSWSFSGTGTGQRTPRAAGSGLLAWAGQGAAAAPEVPFAGGSGGGTWLFGGFGSARVDRRGSGAGTVGFAGSGTGRRSTRGSGGGTWSFSGTGGSKRVAGGSGGGTWSTVGTGTGYRLPKGRGSGTLRFRGAGKVGAGQVSVPILGVFDSSGVSTAAFDADGATIGDFAHEGATVGAWFSGGLFLAGFVDDGVCQADWTSDGVYTGIFDDEGVGVGQFA